MIRHKKPSGLEQDVRPLDHLLLELPAEARSSGKTIRGKDFATGFYEGTRTIEGKKFVVLKPVQKDAYSQPEKTKYPLDQINSYEVVRRYTPDPKDEFDKVIVWAMNEEEERRTRENKNAQLKRPKK